MIFIIIVLMNPSGHRYQRDQCGDQSLGQRFQVKPHSSTSFHGSRPCVWQVCTHAPTINQTIPVISSKCHKRVQHRTRLLSQQYIKGTMNVHHSRKVETEAHANKTRGRRISGSLLRLEFGGNLSSSQGINPPQKTAPQYSEEISKGLSG